jgi:TusA-related sulfurtransferase
LASLALEKKHPGEFVDVLADDVTTRRDLPGWCAEFGHRVLEIVDLRKGFRIRIQKAWPGIARVGRTVSLPVGRTKFPSASGPKGSLK